MRYFDRLTHLLRSAEQTAFFKAAEKEDTGAPAPPRDNSVVLVEEKRVHLEDEDDSTLSTSFLPVEKMSAAEKRFERAENRASSAAEMVTLHGDGDGLSESASSAAEMSTSFLSVEKIRAEGLSESASSAAEMVTLHGDGDGLSESASSAAEMSTFLSVEKIRAEGLSESASSAGEVVIMYDGNQV